MQLEKTADVLRKLHWFPREMTPEKQAHKVHTENVGSTLIGQSKYTTWHRQSESDCIFLYEDSMNAYEMIRIPSIKLVRNLESEIFMNPVM